MGIVCSLYRAPDSTLTALVERPEFFHDFEMLEEKPLKFEVKPSFFGRLFGQRPRTVQLGHDELPFERITENERHYLDKSWHGLHYLMTGGAAEIEQPLGFLLSGGAAIGARSPEQDVVPRVFLSDKTRCIAEEMERLKTEILASRFDWPEMMRQEVYPEIRIQERFPPQLWEGYQAQFLYLKDFLIETAKLKKGLAISYG